MQYPVAHVPVPGGLSGMGQLIICHDIGDELNDANAQPRASVTMSSDKYNKTIPQK